MAESLSSISVASRSGSKIYLSGTACGDTGKNYCINCYVYSNGLSGWVGNSSYNYTYFGGGCLDMEQWGCYVPDYGDGKYRIYLDEVSGGCNDLVRMADAYTLEVTTDTCSDPSCSISKSSITPSDSLSVKVYVDVYHGSGEDWLYSNPYIEWGDGDRTYNTTDGLYDHTYESEGTYLVKLFAINDCYGTCTDYIYMTVEGEAESIVMNVQVEDQHDTTIAGAQVSIPNALGAETISTNSSGVAVGFTLEKDKTHTMSVTYLPSGDWETTSDSTRTFTATRDSTYILYVNKKATDCTIDFNVYDQSLHPVSGVRCEAGGKSATTNSSGMCSITLTCDGSYTATCTAPYGYTCSCGGCLCSDGPFTLTGDGSISFFMDEKEEEIVYCQQDFKVIDQHGDPVEGVIIGCEDRTNNTNFDVYGHAEEGTTSDGKSSTLQTISGRAYNTYVSQYPYGYEWDADGDSIFHDITMCTGEIVFSIKKEADAPSTCPGKTRAECDADANCYWWTSDSACHSSPDYGGDVPILTVTSDMDDIVGIDVYIDGAMVGITPFTTQYGSGDSGSTVSVVGSLFGTLFTKEQNIELITGNNGVHLEILMDNKEILAGGALASVVLLKVL